MHRRSFLLGLLCSILSCKNEPLDSGAAFEHLIDAITQENLEEDLYCDLLDPGKFNRTSALSSLVRIGVPALPSLLSHLSDDRDTLFQVGPPALCAWFDSEYDPRFDRPLKLPDGVHTINGDLARGDRLAHYRLKVADICYEAIGQIVNRRLWAVRDQPSLCIVVNSPLRAKALAEAVRKDWAGLTAAQHRESLIRDAWAKRGRVKEALERLLIYYPAQVEHTVLALLNRPIYDEDVVLSFIESLVRADGQAEWERLLHHFRVAEGDAAADSVPFRLCWMFQYAELESSDEVLEYKRKAGSIQRLLFPSYDFYDTPTPTANLRDQVEVIEGIASMASEKVDRAAMALLMSAITMHIKSESGIDSRDNLVFACYKRLQGKSFDRRFQEYVRRRLSEAESTFPAEHGTIATYRSILSRLKG